VPQSDAKRYAADGGYQLAVSERQCLRGGDELFSGWPTQGVLVSIVEQVDRVVQITVTPLRKRATSAPVAFSDQPYDAAADGGAVWQQRCQSANKEALPFGLGTQWGGCYGSMTLSEVADAMLGRGFDFS
jgi:hypothetical protein